MTQTPPDDRSVADLSREMDLLWASHERIHRTHETAHEREHGMTTTAIAKAEEAMEKRLEAMNEFRDQLREQAATFVTRAVVEQMDKERVRRDEERAKVVDELVRWRAGIEGRMLGVSLAVGVVVIVINIAIRFL